MRWLECLVPPPVVGLVAALGMWWFGRQEAPLAWPRAPLAALGIALIVAGAACAVMGFLTFKRAGANPDPRHPGRSDVLVTHRMYRFTRNPMYLGTAVVLLGAALAAARPIDLLGPVVYVAYLTGLQVLPEERALRAKFGAAFEAYCRATRRWL